MRALPRSKQAPVAGTSAAPAPRSVMIYRGSEKGTDGTNALAQADGVPPRPHRAETAMSTPTYLARKAFMKTQFSPSRFDAPRVALVVACAMWFASVPAFAAQPVILPIPTLPPLPAMDSALAMQLAQMQMRMPSAAATDRRVPPNVVAQPANASTPLTLDAGKGVMLQLNEDAVSVFIADPAVADVQVPSPKAVFVFGKKSGSTTLYVLGANNRTLVQRTVTVTRDMVALQNMLNARFPGKNVVATTGSGSLEISGQLHDARDADAVVQAVRPFLMDKEVLLNRMTVDWPLQVQLRVRITEVDRNVTQQLGINWQAMGNAVDNFYSGVFSGRQIYNLSQPITSGGTSYPVNLPTNNAFSLFGGYRTNNVDIRALVDALNQEGLLTVLAEPNLVALSGQTASLLAGGEFPIPI